MSNEFPSFPLVLRCFCHVVRFRPHSSSTRMASSLGREDVTALNAEVILCWMNDWLNERRNKRTVEWIERMHSWNKPMNEWMNWNEMLRNEMKWNYMNEWMNELKCNETKCHAMKWNEWMNEWIDMKRNEMKWMERQQNEMKRHGMKRNETNEWMNEWNWMNMNEHEWTNWMQLDAIVHSLVLRCLLGKHWEKQWKSEWEKWMTWRKLMNARNETYDKNEINETYESNHMSKWMTRMT